MSILRLRVDPPDAPAWKPVPYNLTRSAVLPFCLVAGARRSDQWWCWPWMLPRKADGAARLQGLHPLDLRKTRHRTRIIYRSWPECSWQCAARRILHGFGAHSKLQALDENPEHSPCVGVAQAVCESVLRQTTLWTPLNARKSAYRKEAMSGYQGFSVNDQDWGLVQ
jgi:hypothetical protein